MVVFGGGEAAGGVEAAAAGGARAGVLGIRGLGIVRLANLNLMRRSTGGGGEGGAGVTSGSTGHGAASSTVHLHLGIVSGGGAAGRVEVAGEAAELGVLCLGLCTARLAHL